MRIQIFLPLCIASLLGAGAAGCANAKHLGALELGSQAVADALREGGDDSALAGVVGRYDEVRIYTQHTGMEPPYDVMGERLIGAGSVAGWVMRIRARTLCADPDTCPWAALDVPAEASAWRCAGQCCEVDVVNTTHRILYLERVCFAASPLHLDAIHLVDGD